MPSGGSIIIERTEALTVIDVNTGKNVGSSNLEETVYRNNLEAADVIARELRLRDIGGIIVIDFIDMEIKSNREAVEEAFREALARDKTRTQVFPISELGLLEMTRKRVSEGLVEAFSVDVPRVRRPRLQGRRVDARVGRADAWPVTSALLRGINLGKRSLSSATLREACAEAGGTDVQTVVQSGNVVFTHTARSAAKVAAELERVLGEVTGFDRPDGGAHGERDGGDRRGQPVPQGLRARNCTSCSRR